MSRGVRPEENIDYEEDNPRFQQQKYPTRVPGFDNHQMAQDEVNDIEFLCDDGRPMQFIRYDKQTRKFTVNQEVCDILQEVKGNVGFCSLAGKYRTGKSFLLNQLLCLKGAGFKVNPTVHACTEGIWIWSKPVYNTNENVSIFFLDTEGLDSVEGSSDHDAKIFALAMLMSSYFMFNSVGCIDESSINQLSLVCHLVNNIAISSDHSQGTQMYDLSYFAPKFLWILRDFILEVRDVRGNPVTPAQYLESALCDVGHIRNLTEKSKRIREGIINFFRERDCVTMVIPCTDERDIKNLDNLARTSIRPEFSAQVNRIREKIFTQCGPKKLNGCYMSSRMYIKMVEEYVRSINSGSVPMIQNAWQSVLENECIVAQDKAKQEYDAAFKELFADQSRVYRREDLMKQLKELRDRAFTSFSVINSVKEGDEDMFNKYMEEVIQHIKRKEAYILEQNVTLSEGQDNMKLNNLSKEMKSKLSKGYYNSKNLSELYTDYDRILDGFEQEGVGPTRNKTLCEYLKTMQFTIFQSVCDKVSSETAKEMSQAQKKKATLEEKQREYDHRLRNLDARLDRFHEDEKEYGDELKNLEKKNRLMEDQWQETKSQVEELKQQVKDLEERKEIATKQLNTLDLERRELQNKSKGICG